MHESAIAGVHIIRSRVTMDQSCGDALSAMEAEGLLSLPIVDEDGHLAGVVSRGGIENGCRGMGHDPDRCRVRNHMRVDVETCGPGQALMPDIQSAARDGPVVVVEQGGIPVGLVRAASALPS